MNDGATAYGGAALVNATPTDSPARMRGSRCWSVVKFALPIRRLRARRRDRTLRVLPDVNQPSPPPPPGGEPRPRPRDGRALFGIPAGWSRKAEAGFPPIEPKSRRARIRPARLRHVLSPIHEHVDQRTPHLARCAERAGVVAIAPHSTAPAEHAIDRARKANREPCRAARQRFLVGRLDHEVNVIRLHREMDDPKPDTRSTADRPPHLQKHPLFSQTRQPSFGAQRQVQWMPLRVVRPRGVRHARTSTRGLSASPRSPATPRSKRKL